MRFPLPADGSKIRCPGSIQASVTSCSATSGGVGKNPGMFISEASFVHRRIFSDFCSSRATELNRTRMALSPGVVNNALATAPLLVKSRNSGLMVPVSCISASRSRVR